MTEEIKLPRNCRIVRQEPQPMKPTWGRIGEHGFHGGHGLVTTMTYTTSVPDDELLVLENPRGTDPHAVARALDDLGHLWDIALWDRPEVLLIRNGPLKYEQLWVNGKPDVYILYDVELQRDLYHLLIIGFWSMLGPSRVANMRLEGMEQAKKLKGEELSWGSWSSFVNLEG